MRNLILAAIIVLASCSKTSNNNPSLTNKVWVNEGSENIRITFSDFSVYFAVCNCSHFYFIQGNTMYVDGNVPVTFSLTNDTLTLLAVGGYPTKYYAGL